MPKTSIVSSTLKVMFDCVQKEYSTRKLKVIAKNYLGLTTPIKTKPQQTKLSK